MQKLKAVELAAEQLAHYREQGFLVMPQLLSPGEVNEIRDVFMRQTADGPVEGLSDLSRNMAPDDPLARYPRIMQPHRRQDLLVGPVALRYLLDERIEAVVNSLLGEPCAGVQSMFYFKPPGSRGQDLHQDNFYLRVKPGTCIAAWISIDDSDAENGGMVCVPGSHNMKVVCPETADPNVFFTSEHVPVPAGLEEFPIKLMAGDTLFFNGSLIHGSYPNQSANRFRRAFICHYIPESSQEVAHWYTPALTFDGREIFTPEALGGGPCGTMVSADHPH